MSTLAVASSNTIILDYFNIVLPKQISYFYPIENTDEALDISVCIPLFNLFTSSNKSIYFNTSIIYSSVNSSKGSKFLLIEPANTNGIWGIILIEFLTLFNPWS